MTTIRTYTGTYNTRQAFLLGDEFSVRLLCSNCTESEALHEYDEQFGERVDRDDPALNDYDGDTLEDRIETAIDEGDIRVNDGGTMVWVSSYEWMHTFESTERAMSYVLDNDPNAVFIDE